MLQVCSLLVLPPKTSGLDNRSKVLYCLPPLCGCASFSQQTLWLIQCYRRNCKKTNPSCNKAELLLTSLHRPIKKRVFVRLCVKRTFLYTPLSIPGVVLLVYPLFCVTSDCDHAFRLNLASSLHLLPLPIRSDTGRWLPSLTSCQSSLAWHHLPQTASLTLPVKTTSNCYDSSRALSHRHGPNEGTAGAERVTNGDVYVIRVCPQ